MNEKEYIFGIRAVLEAVQAKKGIDKVFIHKDSHSELMRELLSSLKKNNISFSYVPLEKLNKFNSKNHQGVVAIIAPISFANLDNVIEETLNQHKIPFFLILDGVSDVRNFGAIIRTASCTGIDAIIIAKQGSAPVNADTIKTSAGAVFTTPIIKVDHIKDALFTLQANNIKIVAATEKVQKFIYETNLKQPIAIIMGSEEKGINPSVLKMADFTVKLPMYGSISSLNVSVACGAIIYEAVRQRLEL